MTSALSVTGEHDLKMDMRSAKGRIGAVFKEMRARIKEADKSVPQKDGDFLYWIEFEEGAEF